MSYSRQRHHNLLLEIKTADLSRSRDSHYKGEFILRHPVTRLDIRAIGEIIHNKLESFVNMKVNTVDMRQVQHVHEVKGSLSKIKQQIDIVVSTITHLIFYWILRIIRVIFWLFEKSVIPGFARMVIFSWDLKLQLVWFIYHLE